MAQQTNLNVSPYFDDYNENDGYYKVLFKPGYPVQARELTTLQSILQNQIERFGKHFFKEGSKVIPGNIGFNPFYYAVQLNNTYLGVPVSAYADQLVGKKITGQKSGITATVDSILLPQNSERGNLTLYINYLSSSLENNSSQQFFDGESLVCDADIDSNLLGNSTISAGNPFAITLDRNSTAVGSSFNISEGVYFVRGQFLNVSTETLILDQYTNKPSYRVGLFVNEEIITSDIDETLTDNSQGFNNYSAPGADRLRITLSLFKKSLTDFNDANFIELATIDNGVVRSKVKTSEYTNILADELARRTYSESGDYVVESFDVSVKESLDDGLGNSGIFKPGQFTYGGSIPSDDNGVYKISPGKAFVRGYEVELSSPTFIDFTKPRTTKTLQNQQITYKTGSTFSLNRVYGSPEIGFGKTYVSLRDEIVGSSSTTAAGREIGVARIYDFQLESGSFEVSNLDLNRWDISLYDIQTVTEITVNEPITLQIPTFVRGLSSGATGFLKDSVSSGKNIRLYEVNGTFIKNESFSFDGINSNIVAVDVRSYSLSDVRSIYSKVGLTTFSADIIPTNGQVIGLATVGPSRYFNNEILSTTSLTSTVGIGSTIFYLDDINYTLNDIDYIRVGVGQSITVAGILTNVPIVSVGNSFIRISPSFADNVGISTTTRVSQTAGIGSNIIYVDQQIGVTIGSSISVGAAITNARVVEVGTNFVKIGSSSTTSAIFRTTINYPVPAGSEEIYIGGVSGPISDAISIGSSISILNGPPKVVSMANSIHPDLFNTPVDEFYRSLFLSSISGISIGNSITVGTAITNARIVGIADTYVTLDDTTPSIGSTIAINTSAIVSLHVFDIPVVGVGTTSVTIGIGDTLAAAIGIGTSVFFSNVSSVLAGSAVTFSKVSRLTSGIGITISYRQNTNKIVSRNPNFIKSVKVKNVLSYTDTSKQDPIISKVVSVGSSSVEVVPIVSVVGIASSALPTTSSLEVLDLKILTTPLKESSDNTLYTKLPKQNIQSVGLSNADLVIKKSYRVNISNKQLSEPLRLEQDETFLPFDEERYSLIRSDGKAERLTEDKLKFTDGGSELQIYNLGSNNNSAILIVTIRKINVKNKVKLKNRMKTLLVDKSNLAESTVESDGLIFGNYPYGTRVQDENISLLTPDIISIHGIFESTDGSDPSAPTAIVTIFTGTNLSTSDLVVGEIIKGETNGAIALVAEKLGPAKISFVYLNGKVFTEGETISFDESGIQAQVISLEDPSSNISSHYLFVTGQKDTIYDYGYITRKDEFSSPSGKIKIYFETAFYDEGDGGDITTTNSYSSLSYKRDIQSINGVRNTDLIDIRPRVSEYQISEGSRSPFEFYGRNFQSEGNSASNILASDESFIIDYSYYLGRIDRIYVSKDGKFSVKYGSPDENPEKPVSIDDALELAVITLPPYVYSVSDISLEFLSHKRYKMSDIKKLEDRIRNLEYYTSLSLLETNTANMFIPDTNGLNKFKSGFFVDNFSSLLSQENDIARRNSVDFKNGHLRPRHYTTSIDLIPNGLDSNSQDITQSPIDGINVRRTGDIITLDYSQIVWLKQEFATRSESVTPFLISFWQGTMELTPSTDTWLDTVRLAPKIINTEGNYASVLADAVSTEGVDPQTGFAPTVWNAWETIWTGSTSNTFSQNRNVSSTSTARVGGWINGFRGTRARVIETNTDSVVQDNFTQVTETGVEQRTGVRTIVHEQFDQTSVGDRTVSRNVIPYMRERNIEFVAKKIKPLTRMYAFFDGVDVTKYCIPKLIEIRMQSGTFTVGETVEGRMSGQTAGSDLPEIQFRIARSNHKEGPYDSPTKTFTTSPYGTNTVSQNYTSTSTTLNVDTLSLSTEFQGSYSGWIETGMILVGKTSNARAIVTNLRLISDISATLIGSFYIPTPHTGIHPSFESGKKVLTLVNNPDNNQNTATTIAEEIFTSSGTIETVQENIISVRNARIENKQEFEERAASRTNTTQLVNSRTISSTSSERQIGWYDPLAQSFLVDDTQGVFLTRCDVFFRSKDDSNVPVTFQLRTMQNGYPTQHVIPFSEIVIDPDDVQTSTDGSVATPIFFKSPIYLEGGKEYCMCLASLSTKYSVYISRIGETDLIKQTFISNQPYLGSLFKSQNASTWEASQWEDLKFTLYRADFVRNGVINLYNPDLSQGNKQIPKLTNNPITMRSKRIRVSISSTLSDAQISIGNTIYQEGSSAQGVYLGSAGIVTGNLNVLNVGLGYTPAEGSYTFNDVSLNSITGNGRGALANVTVKDGSIVSTGVTITNGGIGYKVGDVLEISSIGDIDLGRNSRLSVTSIDSENELIIGDVRGEFTIGAGTTLKYISSSGISTDLNYESNSGPVSISNISVVRDGLHFRVSHKNHGLHSTKDKVIISNVMPDIPPTKLNAEYSASSTGFLSVENSSIFGIFENIGVSEENPGYILIGSEIIKYTSVSDGILGGSIVRGENPRTYPIGTKVYKYELNGISLRRINKTHSFENVDFDTYPIRFDSYSIKVDTKNDGFDRSVTTETSTNIYPSLFFNRNATRGGNRVRATQNIPYQIITPNVQNVTVQGTSLSGQIRTITANSISGNEIPFTDNGFENVSINQSNYLPTPRLIASKVNQDNSLINVSNIKSLNLRLVLDTLNSKLSPVIDTQRVSAILTSNRVDKIISNYSEDFRVSDVKKDPTSFQYISKEITLEYPATSIKVFLNAHINEYSDIRVFYAISENSGFSPIFLPFPGYNNLDSRGQIIDFDKCDGLPDKFVQKENSKLPSPIETEFREYTFTIEELPTFRNFRVKILGTSTNQVYVPIIKDLRVISLA